LGPEEWEYQLVELQQIGQLGLFGFIQLQQIQFQRLGWAGTQRRLVGHEQWRRRMEFEGFQRSRFRKLWSQVIPMPPKQMQAWSIFVC
jgi:hypothetical protein